MRIRAEMGRQRAPLWLHEYQVDKVDGWETYAIRDVSTAAWRASRKDGLKWDKRLDLFAAYLETRMIRCEGQGLELPNLIDMERLDMEPDAVAQMDLVWLLFGTAAKEECRPEQRQALLGAARAVTEMCRMDDLLLDTVKPNVAKLAKGLRAELDDIRDSIPDGKKMLEEAYPHPTEPAM